MRLMTFSICCAVCNTHYIHDKIAEVFKHVNPWAYEFIIKAHYMDDLINTYNIPKQYQWHQQLNIFMQIRNRNKKVDLKV